MKAFTGKHRIGIFMRWLFSGAFVFFILSSAQIASSQVSIQLGGDFGYAKRSLQSQGYSQIQQVGQGFTKFHVEACKNGTRYWFKSDGRGRVNAKQQIGICQATININQARQILVNQGYTRINLEDRQGTFTAVACQGNDRVRISVNYLGQLGGRLVLGQCRQSLNPADVSAVLQREGYTRIRFTHRQLPIYRAEACLGKRKFRLELNQFGQTISQKRAGNCRGPLNANRLAQWMSKRGYTQVNVIDNQLPRYIIEGCKGRQREELTINRYGDVIERYDAGQCAAKANISQVINKMKKQGFSEFYVKKDHASGFQVYACHSKKRYDVEFDIYGEYKGDKQIGACKALTLRQITSAMQREGFRQIEYSVKTCSQGKLYRYTINKFGERSNLEKLGRCR